MSATTTITRQLRAMLRLTQTEAQIARRRTAQARTEEVRRTLEQHRADAERRARLIAEQLGELGGVPDALTAVLGHFTAVLKTALVQGEPFDEALLRDLALEQQLLARARRLRALAQAADKPSVRALAEQLEKAHAQTVDWISMVLAEEAPGGPAARATPLQRAAGGATRMFALPVRAAREGLDRAMDGVRAVDSLGTVNDMVRDGAQGVTDRALRFGRAVRDIATGRDTGPRHAESVTRPEGASDTAAAVHETRREPGTLSDDELRRLWASR